MEVGLLEDILPTGEGKMPAIVEDTERIEVEKRIAGRREDGIT